MTILTMIITTLILIPHILVWGWWGGGGGLGDGDDDDDGDDNGDPNDIAKVE